MNPKDSSDLTSSPISVVVHDHGVETVGGVLLLLGLGEAPLDGGGVVLAALEEIEAGKIRAIPKPPEEDAEAEAEAALLTDAEEPDKA